MKKIKFYIKGGKIETMYLKIDNETLIDKIKQTFEISENQIINNITYKSDDIQKIAVFYKDLCYVRERTENGSKYYTINIKGGSLR